MIRPPPSDAARPSESAAPSYRPCVGVMLINRAGLVFVGRRRREAGPEHVDDGHAWQMPQGGIDPGETPREAALRELYEETNVAAASVRVLAEAPDWLTYDLPGAIADRAWRGRYRGQTQRWFALAFEGEDAEVDVHRPGGGHHRAEFDAWRWEHARNLPGLVIPFKRAVYEAALAALGAHLRPRLA